MHQKRSQHDHIVPHGNIKKLGPLIQQHLDACRIRPSNSAHASPAFIIPKAVLAVLPRWVNDYWALNGNTVTDAHPLLRVDNILTDCAKGKIWSVIDMTNSFFQTRVHPDDIHLTAVTTPFGLYEWLAMPMGLHNSPAIHQQRMTAALREHIGKICHIYLDDIIIWSNTIAEHIQHIDTVIKALQKARLYCNPNKCKFFQEEVDFLGHHISQRGIKPNSSKIDKVLNWPVLKSMTDVRGFLGLVRYVSVFLPNLADHTCILTPLTTKDAKKLFPAWTLMHQEAFEAIKALVVSAECLTTIDHNCPGDNKIFVTCDASDWRIGTTLSFGPTWETAHPVAFDSLQLKAAEKNYPVHEKELLAIIRALNKWRSDLLGTHFYVYTDH
jgi:RNase H-like domain found in reverse transcriptase/Reverse transcriptase (RNA-dependent DNA polymerase)